MRQLCAALTISVVLLLVPSSILAQSSQPAQAVPRVITITGVFQPVDGQPPRAVETLTLSLYANPVGGEALWQEVQTVAVDVKGHYTVLLGATRADGIPADALAAGAEWLGLRFDRPGETEAPRMRLTSVPYALRAADADTLGGHPASAYLLAPTGSTSDGHAATTAAGATTPASGAGALSAPGASTQAILTGTPNLLAKYSTTTDVGPSALFENNGMVGLGTTTPFDIFHVRYTNTDGSLTGFAVQNLGNTAASYSGMLFYDQNGALGQFQGFNNVTHEYRINNIAPGGSINFMIGSSSKFLVANNGNIGIGAVPSATDKLSVAGNATVNGNVVANGQMQVLAAQNGLRVQTNTVGGFVGSFGGVGEFDIDAPFVVGGRLAVKESGNVGVGVPNPSQKLSIAGTVESTTGGFKFPDGSVQTTAANVVYVDFPQTIPALPDTFPGLPVLHLDVPNGTYFVEASMNVSNANNGIGSNNNRTIQCQIPQSLSLYSYELDLAGDSTAILSVHAVVSVVAGIVELQCSVLQSGLPTFVGVHGRQLTAVRIGDSVVVQTGG